MEPILLLDIDGVIHDRLAMRAIGGSADPEQMAVRLDVEVVRSHGRQLAIPRYMPGLVSMLVETCDSYWCSTWRGRANDDLPGYLGIPELPWLDDGTNGVGLDWKTGLVAQFLASPPIADRRVYWIEDFHGEFPALVEEVTFVDTGDEDVLMHAHIPGELVT